MSAKKILITGGAGYIGSVLCRLLVEQGFHVTVVDRFYFGDNFGDLPNLQRIVSDSRNFDPSLLQNVYAVFDLAAISNDPAGDLNRQKTLDINYRARRRLQELCVEIGVEKYVLASSCSVYGFQDGVVDEDSQVNPLTTYAEANLLAEASAFGNRGASTSFTALRQATVFGLSPRMRFDLVVNAMSLNVAEGKSLQMLRDGSQWRPLVHVRDTSKAFISCLKADKDLIDGQIINVGANTHNFQVLQIAEEISAALGRPLDIEWYGDPDARSYKVNFDKASRLLNFAPEWTIGAAALEISEAINSGALVANLKTSTLGWYKELGEMESVINSLRHNQPIF